MLSDTWHLATCQFAVWRLIDDLRPYFLSLVL
jgi:hypothetical protein